MDFWWLRAECRGMDLEFFFQQAQKPALAVCAGCPVTRQCLAEAMEAEKHVPKDDEDPEHGAYRNYEMRHGVAGGMTAFQRWAMVFPDQAATYKERERERAEKSAAAQAERNRKHKEAKKRYNERVKAEAGERLEKVRAARRELNRKRREATIARHRASEVGADAA